MKLKKINKKNKKIQLQWIKKGKRTRLSFLDSQSS
jgi:hypothetical protein